MSGLRERKKARTRAAIQRHAIRLFREHGYDATTVEQIAAAAEVSPSTFFRYFPTKEDVLLRDDLDEAFVAAFREQPPGRALVPAVRATLREQFARMSEADQTQMRQANELALSVPSVRMRVMDELTRSLDLVGAAIADRAGRAADDPEVRALAGMILGVVLAAWFDSGGDFGTMLERLDAGLKLMEDPGLPL